MKALRTSLITAGLLATLASSAMAQMGPGGMPGHDTREGHHGPRTEKAREHMREQMAERHAQHLATLKAKLQLSATQEAAWKTFADAMQPPAAPPARIDRAAMDKLSTPERIDQMQAMHAQRDAEMKKRGDAAKTFYASLSAEQKKAFDAETARFMAGASGQRMHGGQPF